MRKPGRAQPAAIIAAESYHAPEAVTEPPLHNDVEIPPPAPEARTVYIAGLFLVAVAAVFYVAADIILPIVVALVLTLVLQPAMRVLVRLRVPRGLAAVLLLLLLFGLLAAIVTALSGPAGNLARSLPQDLPKLQQRLSFLGEPIAAFQRLVGRAQALLSVTTIHPLAVTLDGNGLPDRLLYGTRYLVSGIGQTVLVLFFLLVAGDRFLRRLVEVLPRFHNKRQAVEIAQRIERDISAYLVTITVMNALVGIATGIAVALCGLGDPVFWGTLAFLLNYVPILGPIVGIVIFLLAGLLAIDTLWVAILPAGLYLCIHLLEGEAITPLLLARRFTINPVLIIIGLIFWYWMWGIPGAILATPMLAIIKIICDEIRPLAPFGHVIEG
jgi:predicted PurR-regulated permease PerM